jgi:hypothetical protein
MPCGGRAAGCDNPSVIMENQEPDDSESEDVESDDMLYCGYCGRRQWPDSEGKAPGWLYVRIERDSAEPIYQDSCLQPHAATWFTAPLPEPVPWTLPAAALSVRGRLVEGAVIAFVLSLLALVLVGAWSVVRWLARLGG